MNIRWLECFVAAAQELNFGRAAERLGMAQPPLSRIIKQIESEIGTKLFHRGRTQVKLTQAGERLLVRATDILIQIDETIVEVRSIGQGAKGRVNLGFVSSALYEALPRIMKSYRGDNPEMSVGLFPMNNAPLQSALLTGKIDIALSRAALSDPEILSRPLLRESLIAALPEGHALSGQESIDLDDLGETPLVLYPEMPRPSFADEVLAHLGPTRAARHAKLLVMDSHTALSLVSVGAGLSIMPASAAQSRHPGVHFVPLSDPALTSELTLNVRADNQSVHAKQFIDAAFRTLRHRGAEA